MKKEEEIGSKEKQLTFAFRQAILKAHKAKVGSKIILIHHMDDLIVKNPEAIMEKNGPIDFEATAGFHFVPKDGISFSFGDRPNFRGTINKEGDTFEIMGPLFIKDNVNTNNLKECEDE